MYDRDWVAATLVVLIFVILPVLRHGRIDEESHAHLIETTTIDYDHITVIAVLF